MEARDGIRELVDWWFDRRSVEKVWPKEGPSTELAACLGSQRLRVQPSNPGSLLGLVESASPCARPTR